MEGFWLQIANNLRYEQVLYAINSQDEEVADLKKILSDYEKQENYSEKIRPIFDGEYDDFTLTLFNVNYNDTQDDTQDDTKDDTQESIEVKIEKLIRGNNKISTKEMAEKLNVGVATIKRKIKTMSNLKYIGSGYSGHWELDE